jgi:hypothetical protein
MLSFRKSLRASLLPNYLVIVMMPLFAWGQDSACREHATGAMHVQKSTKRFPDGRPKAEYWFYRGKDCIEVLHGKYTTWSESGQKFSEQEYLNGALEGRTTYFGASLEQAKEGPELVSATEATT